MWMILCVSLVMIFKKIRVNIPLDEIKNVRALKKTDSKGPEQTEKNKTN